MKKYFSLLLAVIIIVVSFYGCAPKSPPELALKDPSQSGAPPQEEGKPELKRYNASFLELFDTVTFLIGYAPTEQEFMIMAEEVKKELETYHKLYDIYNSYDGINNIKTVNDNAGISPVKVDERLIDLVEYGVEIHRRTDGLTNIAMGSVLKIWHDYRTDAIDNPESARLPNMEELSQAAEHMDIDKVIIDRREGTIYLADEKMSLDVGSLGKGYAVEMVCQTMEKNGVDHILLSVGGNVRAVGKKPDGGYWHTGIENPYGRSDNLAVVNMDGGALVTSGNYQRYYMVDGVRYHHIINPNTLLPENNMSAVAVLCDDSGLADGLSTAVFNMTVEEGRRWVEDQAELEAMWMLADETIIYSSGFEQHIKPSE